ncbi:SRPBCC family protein [Brevibacterium sp. JSBI002]|uniref:SRPBCC family protein n=1 Tax=Brevibacterium sp. JSBI002 TaxID=2886045 RepID=UPI00222ED4BC|nr:SRPBCC family protein [Brevibacterium sp. JSBI002]UZD61535.1 SRPBCC family protein [Brevibacterium sp. JSBI002]
MTNPALHLSTPINVSPAEVAAFAGDPANLPAWAAGLSNGIREEAGRWITDSPMGEVEVRFGPHTDLGILGHDVIFPDGTVVLNPLRVLTNGTGAEVVFTLFRLPGVDLAEFDRDADMVRADLARLRAQLESAHGCGTVSDE